MKLRDHANWAGKCRSRENSNSCDKIPPSVSCVTDTENFTAVCTNAAVLINVYKMKARSMLRH